MPEKHWSDAYRGNPSVSLPGKIYLAACNGVEDEAHARAVGQLAFDENLPIWHALWELGPKKFPCYCARCQPTIGMNK